MTSTKYPNHSIGEHTIDFPLTFYKNDTVGEVLKKIKEEESSWPNTEFIFVINHEGKLIGTVSFKQIIAEDPKKELEELMKKNFIYLTDHSHQESAAKLAVKTGFETIPVVDKYGHFVGIVNAGQIFKIMHEGQIDKLMHFSGILDNPDLVSGYKANVFKVAKSRLPWLVMGLLGGILSTLIVEQFSHTLEQVIALAFFIPVIVYMNDAVGTQTQTIFVRYSSLEKISLTKALFYELKVSSMVGVILSLIIFVFVAIWLGVNIALIVTLSMYLGIFSSAIIGTIIPWLLQRAGKDPAIGSGPFTTIIQDLLSILIYFSIASILL